MASLRNFGKLSARLLAAISLVLGGCGGTVTKVDFLETDTTLSSADPTSHAETPTLNVSRSSTLEERAIFKLPTGSRDSDSTIDQIFSNPIDQIVFFPFLLGADILSAIFACPNESSGLAASELTSAHLRFDVASTTEASLDGKLDLVVVARPWWQTANWQNAHFFSSSGAWSTPGGDVDPSTPAVPNTLISAGTIDFDVTSYFRAIIASSQPVHFGMMIEAASAILGETQLASVQTNGSFERPRVVSTYQCGAASTAASHVYYLGTLSRP
jgi:hypothetical protein